MSNKLTITVIVAGVLTTTALAFFMHERLLSQGRKDLHVSEKGGQTLSFAVEIDGVERQYRVHFPSRIASTKTYPLMISFHANGENGKQQESMTHFSEISDEESFIVAYPEAVDGAWNISEASADVRFAKQVIKTLQEAYPIDTKRLYVNGFAEGGALAQALACIGTTIAGMAVVSNNLSSDVKDWCRPSAPIGVVFFAGTGDLISPYDGSASSTSTPGTLSSEATALFWAVADRCRVKPVISQFSEKLSNGNNRTDTKRVWRGCRGDVTVQLYAVELGGHTWPGTRPRDEMTTGPASTVIDASRIIWDALRQYHR